MFKDVLVSVTITLDQRLLKRHFPFCEIALRIDVLL